MPTFLIILVASLLAAIPAVFWFFLYRWLDKKEPEPPRAMAAAGFLGIISTIPIFGLQFMFSNFPDLNFMQILQANMANPITFSMVFLVFVAVIEELVKAFSTVGITEKYDVEFNQVVDGIVYAASVALGFSFAENIYYFFMAHRALGFSTEFVSVYSIRSLGTMLGHTLFTGVFGFYYAKAYLAPYVNDELRKKKVWHDLRHTWKKALTFHATRRSILPHKQYGKHDEHPGIVILEGFIMAIALHFIYNFFVKIELFGKTWTFLIVPFLFIAAWGLWRMFFKPLYTKVFVRIDMRKKR